MSALRKLRRGTFLSFRAALAYSFMSLLFISPACANFVYNKLPHRWLRLLLIFRAFKPGTSSFLWTVALANNRRLKLKVEPGDKFAVGYAFEYKAHDIGLRRVQEFFLNHSRPGCLYLDIGANIGVSSIYALLSGVECWLFEPNAALHAFVKELYSYNGFTRARWETVALSDTAGTARFYVSQSSFLSSFDRSNAEREGEAIEVMVSMRTLDSYMAEIRATAKELIVKIDVEGHELKVLAGASRVLHEYRPPIMIELLDHPATRSAAWSFFDALGYVGCGICDQPKLKVRALGSADDLIAFHEINFVFMPADHPLRRELFARS